MINVIKAGGHKEEFSEEKVIQSIKRAGISKNIQDQVLNHVKGKLWDNIPSREIYQHITEFLGKSEFPYYKARYSLKASIMELGPTGYPFEDYISEVVKTLGFETKVRTFLKGTCVTHEIDVIALRNNETIMIECKFHNSSGTKSDIHVALYTKARFDDVKVKNAFDKVWLVTNTKVSTDALSYANCSGIKVIAWGYPNGGSLENLVEKELLYPITSISGLSYGEKQILLSSHIVLCSTIYETHSALDMLSLSNERKNRIVDEVKSLFS